MKKFKTLFFSVIMLAMFGTISLAGDNTCPEDPTGGYCNYHIDRPENGPPVHRLSCDDSKNEEGSIYMSVRCLLIPD